MINQTAMLISGFVLARIAEASQVLHDHRVDPIAADLRVHHPAVQQNQNSLEVEQDLLRFQDVMGHQVF